MYKIFLLAFSLLLFTNMAFAAHMLMPNTTDSMQEASFWYSTEGEKIVSGPERIAAINKSMRSNTLYDLAIFPTSVSKNKLKEWLADYQIDDNLYVQGLPMAKTYEQELLTDVQGQINDFNRVKYGVVTCRSNLRSFPTLTKAFATAESCNFDIWQETAVDPGEPAIILHNNTKGNFVFVQLRYYRGWLPRNQVAVTDRATWLHYVEPEEFAIVTGRCANIKQRLYQMGARLPLINGKLLLPERNGQGHLVSTEIPAIFNETLHKGYLPFTRNNLLHMAFKHLGASYGWGGLDDSVDCSSFAQDVYNTVGVHLPRNGDEQAIAFPGKDMETLTREKRINTIRALPAGSLFFTPYHVMLYLGENNGRPYMIHAATSYSSLDAAGNANKSSVMQVIVSDLYLLGGSGTSLLMQMTKATNYH